MTLQRHPATGLTYVMVIPDDWGAYIDYAEGYALQASTTPWLRVVSPAAFHAWAFAQHRDNPRVMFLLWTPEVVPADHACLIVGLYIEAVGDPASMLPDHVAHQERARRAAESYDAMAVHTPGLVAPVAATMAKPTYLFPAGWHPAWGAPRPASLKSEYILFWGSIVGRRVELIPWFRRYAGATLKDCSGLFGRKLMAEIESSRMAIYLAHSVVQSFSTWRLWQMISTSTGLVAEPGETWPWVAGEHYVPIPYFELGDAPEAQAQRLETIEHVHRAWRDPDGLRRVALYAHRDLGPRFTLERCLEDYLVPMSKELVR